MNCEKENEIRVLLIEPGALPRAAAIPNTLEAFQQAVGGTIEAVELEDGVCLICNEEGKLLGLPANRRVGGDVIAGTFLIAGEADGEFRFLPDADAVRCAERFVQPLPDRVGPTRWEFHVM